MSKKEYYIFGLQRSGTNFIENIMSKNFEVRKLNANTSAWKHSIDVPSTYKRRIPTIVAYKNPYTWVESLGLRNCVDWKKRQTKYPADEECAHEYKIGEHNFNIINLAKTYHHFYTTWFVNNPCENRIIIKYEDFLVEKLRSNKLEEIAQAFSLNKKYEQWDIPKRGKVSQSRDYDENREKYYLAMKPSNLTPRHIEAINTHVGEDLIKKMGYTVL
jgi:hypothetical protein